MVLVPGDRAPTHPGEILREEFMKPLKITQEQLAELIGISSQAVNELVNRHRDLTQELALRLERLFGMSSELWMNLQARWDLYQRRRTSWKQIEGLVKPLRKAATAGPPLSIHRSATAVRDGDPQVIPFPGQRRLAAEPSGTPARPSGVRSGPKERPRPAGRKDRPAPASRSGTSASRRHSSARARKRQRTGSPRRKR
jgi:addiction module HigA family antidote